MDLETALAAEEAQRKSQELGSGNAGISQSQPPKVIMHAKPPKLELRKFPGNPIEWYPFWESFESAVHKNPNLSEVDKFNYLKSLLVGTAQNVVAGLALTSANYEKAVELLQARFGNRQIVISSHMEALTRIAKIMSTSEVKRLRSCLTSLIDIILGILVSASM